MLVACRRPVLSALVFDYAVGGAGAQSGGWGCSPSRLGRDSRIALGSYIGRKPAAGPDALKATIPPPDGGARLTGRLKGLAGRSGPADGRDVNLRGCLRRAMGNRYYRLLAKSVVS